MIIYTYLNIITELIYALTNFELDDIFVLPFIREIGCIYLNYDIIVREKTALTCCKILSQSCIIYYKIIISYMLK